MRDMTDVIAMTKYLTKRCFDKVLIYIDMDSPPQEGVFNLMLHQIELLKDGYGEELVNSAGVYFQNSKDVPHDIVNALKKVLHEKIPVSNSNQMFI